MDNIEKNKRKRVPNFTVEEKVLLTKLVNEQKSIVESKLTDGRAIAKKKAAWEVITRDFNSNLNVHKRDTSTLKRAWDNLKAMTRKARAVERGHLIRTGGGPSLPPQPPQHVAIINMVEEASPSLICEIENNFDSDAAAMATTSIAAMSTSISNLEESPALENSENADIVFMEQSQQDRKNEPVFDESEYISTPIFNLPTRKTSDFIRREALLRVKALEAKNKKELQILKLKVDAQTNDTKRTEILLRAAQAEEKRAELLLQAARLEVEFQEKRLKQMFQ